MKNKFIWDKYSDQPYPLADKKYKKMMKKKHIGDLLPLLLTNLIIFPLAVLCSFFFKKTEYKADKFFALCVNLDKGDIQAQLVNELNCKDIQIRVGLADIENLDQYVAFAQKFPECRILINVLQDREHIDNPALLSQNITRIFSAFETIAYQFQIGNAINRTKWGFFSVAEYLSFYQTVQQIRDRDYPQLLLIGPSVIDYEYHFTIRALFNGFKVKYDKLAALLYVDRRGAPENTQMGIFDTTRKIDFLYALAKLSAKSTTDIIISEANWPISGTAPWAPTSETECVDEETYANYLLRYYLLALGSKKISSVYWHQLIAPGFGLIDNREELNKRAAFYVFKQMLSVLHNVLVKGVEVTGERYHLQCYKEQQNISVVWLNSDEKQLYTAQGKVFDKIGTPLQAPIYISASPIYILH
ncbi:MAG: hypothetical protein V7784_01735 [Oceanospirillaceae bacterium]